MHGMWPYSVHAPHEKWVNLWPGFSHGDHRVGVIMIVKFDRSTDVLNELLAEIAQDTKHTLGHDGTKASSQDHKILQRIFDRIDFKKDNKIDKEELEQTLLALGYEPVKINQYGISEVEQMIWEVDEDSDGCVSLAEFQLMFERARNDKTGHEPKKLFNLCQYMCLDRDGDGSITSEECMEMIMHRFGRPKLDEVFRNDAGEREISLSDFLMQVNRNPPKLDKRSSESLKGKMPSIKRR